MHALRSSFGRTAATLQRQAGLSCSGRCRPAAPAQHGAPRRRLTVTRARAQSQEAAIKENKFEEAGIIFRPFQEVLLGAGGLSAFA